MTRRGLLLGFMAGLAPRQQARAKVLVDRLTRAVAAEGTLEVEGTREAVEDTIRRLEGALRPAGFRVERL
jgi:hypothetical protein